MAAEVTSCEGEVNPLSFMQGSLIGILALFIVLCVAIIVILLRRKGELRKKSRNSEQPDIEDQPPQYSRQDHTLFQVPKN